MNAAPACSDSDLADRVAVLARLLVARNWTLASAESCTGGWIGKVCTDRPGSSDWFERGFITYSNAAKTELLAVPAGLIEAQGAVSEAVALAMAAGARRAAGVDIAVAVTGIAGPDGGTADKPIGTVWFGWAGPDGIDAARHVFAGDRVAVRAQSVAVALDGVMARAE